MKPSKIFIVLTHTRRFENGRWEMVEDIEFVSEVRTRHYTTATIVVDYARRKVVARNRTDIANFDQFEQYIWEKYPDQMQKLITKYNLPEPVPQTPDLTVIVDQFGVSRPKTIFDK